MDHISRIGVFIEVVKHNSFSKAARALGLTGPAVSKQVQALEKQLSIKLLERTTRHISLTEEGAVYFEKAQKAISDLHEAEQHIQELKDKPTGKLKINAPTSFANRFLIQPIAKFAKQYPEVNLETVFNNHWVDVIGEGYDVVIRIGVLEDSSLIARKLANCPIQLCASKEFIEEHGMPKTIEDIASLPHIIYSQHSHSTEWRYQDKGGQIGSTTLNRRFSANSGSMQLEACLQGLGIALMPAFFTHELIKEGKLIQILPEYTSYPQRGIYALYPKNRHISARVTLFIETLVEASKSFKW